MRQFLCAALAVAICASAGLSADKDKDKIKGHGKMGKITKVDAENGVVTVNVKSKTDKEGKDTEFKIGDDTKIKIGDGEAKMGKDALKDEKFKEGAMVEVKTDGDKVTEIHVLGMKKPK